ncbi:hypothetical protein BH11PAT2_BH11PAT2_06030 [soil metagenome]
MNSLAILSETDNSFIRAVQADSERTRTMIESLTRPMIDITKIIERMNEPVKRMIEAMPTVSADDGALARVYAIQYPGFFHSPLS